MSSYLCDSFGRTIDYLRLSITDRCNLRCLYCMPAAGVDLISHEEVLRFEELLRICRILTELGIRSVRISGGEPLLRRGIVDLVRKLKTVKGIEQLSMTSNGVLLGEYIEDLAASGLQGVNISLNTLDEERFCRISRAQSFVDILPVIDRALDLGLRVKINCVVLRGFNEEDIVKLTGLAKNKSIALRFIELMPLGAAGNFQPLREGEVSSMIEREYGKMTAFTLKLGKGPAIYYGLPGFKGYIGFISALSHNFCGVCNRLRLSASGVLKPCLSNDLCLDLRSLLRSNASDMEIIRAIRELIAQKPAGHGFDREHVKGKYIKQEMFRIGG